jgi:hypothetical protein
MSQRATPYTIIVKMLNDLFDGPGAIGGSARGAAYELMEKLD